jgi:hypothetical protein
MHGVTHAGHEGDPIRTSTSDSQARPQMSKEVAAIHLLHGPPPMAAVPPLAAAEPLPPSLKPEAPTVQTLRFAIVDLCRVHD